MRREAAAPEPSTATNAFVIAVEIFAGSNGEKVPLRRMTCSPAVREGKAAPGVWPSWLESVSYGCTADAAMGCVSLPRVLKKEGA